MLIWSFVFQLYSDPPSLNPGSVPNFGVKRTVTRDSSRLTGLDHAIQFKFQNYGKPTSRYKKAL